MPHFEIECPRCKSHLLFNAAEGSTRSCGHCDLELEISDGEAVYDRAEARRKMVEFACASCDAHLHTWLPDGESVVCPDCNLSYELRRRKAYFDEAEVARRAIKKAHSIQKAMPPPRRAKKNAEAAAGDALALAASLADRAGLMPLIRQVRLSGGLVADGLDGTFTVSWQTIATLVAALAYFVLPADVIPDILPAVGFTDDAAVLAMAVAAVRSDLVRYARSRNLNLKKFGLDG